MHDYDWLNNEDPWGENLYKKYQGGKDFSLYKKYLENYNPIKIMYKILKYNLERSGIYLEEYSCNYNRTKASFILKDSAPGFCISIEYKPVFEFGYDMDSPLPCAGDTITITSSNQSEPLYESEVKEYLDFEEEEEIVYKILRCAIDFQQ